MEKCFLDFSFSWWRPQWWLVISYYLQIPINLLQPMEKANYILLPARLRREEYLLCFDGSCTWPEFQVGGGWRAANQVLNPPSLPSSSSSSSSIIIIINYHHHHHLHHGEPPTKSPQFTTIIMVTQLIPTMTDSHHGGFLSVMIMVGICQVTKSFH